MTQLMFNKPIANDIFNDASFHEELIMALNELIDVELAKSDDEIDFDLIDAYTDALNELYDEKVWQEFSGNYRQLKNSQTVLQTIKSGKI